MTRLASALTKPRLWQPGSFPTSVPCCYLKDTIFVASDWGYQDCHFIATTILLEKFIFVASDWGYEDCYLLATTVLLEKFIFVASDWGYEDCHFIATAIFLEKFIFVASGCGYKDIFSNIFFVNYLFKNCYRSSLKNNVHNFSELKTPQNIIWKWL